MSFALSSYPAGRLSDVIGRKTPLVTGYAFYGIVYLGFALIDGLDHAWMAGPSSRSTGFTAASRKASRRR